ncbi:MAG: hypothetical protein ACKVQK_08200 [Burkholderiales bacterium]
MKWLRTLILFDQGGVSSSTGWKAIHESYIRSIQSIDFPEGTHSLTLRRKGKRPDGQWDRNGVGFLRRRFLDHMVSNEGWRSEVGFDLGKKRTPPTVQLYPGPEKYQEEITSEFGGFDFVTVTPDGTHVAIEWETGNISSSHRSMNKLAIALSEGRIHAGVLIVPSRDLYAHLTDRIGNIGELSGYLSLWKSLESSVTRGLLAISVVEHDGLTSDTKIPYLKGGTDGRAKEGREKRKIAAKKKKRKINRK